MEFKGTKGKWQVSSDELSNTIEVYKSGKGDICEINTNDYFLIESIWNAKLISKAPEMLEMLISLSKTFEDIWFNHDGEENVLFDKIDAEKLDNLIKSATEL